MCQRLPVFLPPPMAPGPQPGSAMYFVAPDSPTSGSPTWDHEVVGRPGSAPIIAPLATLPACGWVTFTVGASTRGALFLSRTGAPSMIRESANAEAAGAWSFSGLAAGGGGRGRCQWLILGLGGHNLRGRSLVGSRHSPSLKTRLISQDPERGNDDHSRRCKSPAQSRPGQPAGR